MSAATKDELTAVQELREIGWEMRFKHRPQLLRDYIETAHASTSVTPDELPEEIVRRLEHRAEGIPALMDVADGRLDWIAGQVLGLMMVSWADDHDISIDDAITACESVAVEHVLR